MDTVLEHIGTPRHSGRYPWGSGDDPFQSGKDFLGYVNALHKEGLSQLEIANGLKITVNELRMFKSIVKNEKRADDTAMAMRLKEKGYSNVAIGKRMGINESSVRALLNPGLHEKAQITENIAKVLKDAVNEKNYIDVGLGVENHLGISRVKLKNAIAMLKDEGYQIKYLEIPQQGTDKNTSLMVLVKPGVKSSEVYANRHNIKMITDTYSEDGGRTMLGLEPINSVNSSRIFVRYKEDGGALKDGTIELRRGVADISLGNAKYAQVRIGVDGTHYLKGMAMYTDDIPDGVDIVFNTNKSSSLGKMDVLKPMKEGTGNPFGSVVRQRHYQNEKGESKLSAINIVNEEGDWLDWTKSLSSQVLSKQTPNLAKKQLEKAYNLKKEEFDEINMLTNPAVKQKLLKPFSDACDSAAVHLKAAGFPRQAWAVILPFTKMKENEIYAPNHKDGETVVLIRYPHGGVFEIPELMVNNRFPPAKKYLLQAKDAVGINPKVAERLSGADFDGDTVLVIPSAGKNIKTAPALAGLKNFDPKAAYPKYEGMPKLKDDRKQTLMGDISNLITDMTIQGAHSDEIVRAVRHSMVIIDAEKHELNYRQSAIDNGIAGLKLKYQGSKTAGASTLISKAKSEERIPHRIEGQKSTDPITGKTKIAYIDPITGKKLYRETGETYVNKYGKVIKKTSKITKMEKEDDAFNLSSGTIMETVYATHANKLKDLGNAARKEMLNIKPLVYSPSARIIYSEQVASLLSKLNIAVRNKPLERQAQILADSIVRAERKSNPDMTGPDLKKIKGQALTEARLRVGAGKEKIVIEEKEWAAIQAGAISHTSLLQILDNADLNKVKALATPRKQTTTVSNAKIIRARTMLNSGHTQSEVADALGISIAVLQEVINS